MKKVLLSLASTFILSGPAFSFSSSYRSLDENKPVIVSQLPQEVFVPPGFDDNDRVQIVAEGYLPDTCHKVGPSAIQREGNRILVRNGIYVYQDRGCAEMIVPYARTIDLNVLDTGKYEIYFSGNDRGEGKVVKMAEINIKASNKSSPDEFLYAPVEKIFFVAGKGPAAPFLIIEGTMTNSCMQLANVRVLTRSLKVVEVLPIAEMKGKDCQNFKRSFHARVSLENVKPGRKLIYVRSLNGNALNEIADF